jgi:hypothetical protein
LSEHFLYHIFSKLVSNQNFLYGISGLDKLLSTENYEIITKKNDLSTKQKKLCLRKQQNDLTAGNGISKTSVICSSNPKMTG